VTATDGDNAVSRDSLRLPRAAASDVKLITNDSLCAIAAAAYSADRKGTGSGLSGRVYVVKIKNTYVVHDPAYVPNPYILAGFFASLLTRNGTDSPCIEPPS
jgi:hypothetical protein